MCVFFVLFVWLQKVFFVDLMGFCGGFVCECKKCLDMFGVVV